MEQVVRTQIESMYDVMESLYSFGDFVGLQSLYRDALGEAQIWHHYEDEEAEKMFLKLSMFIDKRMSWIANEEAMRSIAQIQ